MSGFWLISTIFDRSWHCFTIFLDFTWYWRQNTVTRTRNSSKTHLFWMLFQIVHQIVHQPIHGYWWGKPKEKFIDFDLKSRSVDVIDLTICLKRIFKRKFDLLIRWWKKISLYIHVWVRKTNREINKPLSENDHNMIESTFWSTEINSDRFHRMRACYTSQTLYWGTPSGQR